MRICKFVGPRQHAFVACAATSLLLVPTPAAATQGSFSSADPLDGFFGTVWHCTTFGGTRLTHVFYRAKGDDAIVVATRFLLPNGDVRPSEEVYRYSDTTDQWTANLARGTMIVTAPAWNDGKTWSFEGTQSNGYKPEPVRMTFTVSGDGVFRREFRRHGAQTWTTYAGEFCRAAQGL